MFCASHCLPIRKRKSSSAIWRISNSASAVKWKRSSACSMKSSSWFGDSMGLEAVTEVNVAMKVVQSRAQVGLGDGDALFRAKYQPAAVPGLQNDVAPDCRGTPAKQMLGEIDAIDGSCYRMEERAGNEYLHRLAVVPHRLRPWQGQRQGRRICAGRIDNRCA